MKTVLIREMTRDDLPAVVAVECDSYSRPWSEKTFLGELQTPHSSIDLLLVDHELAGYLCSWYVCRELHILNVVTAPAFRRQGVARRLIDHVVARSLEKGLDHAFLEVRIGNLPAISLYEKIGFRRDAIRRHYYFDGEDALLMTWLPPRRQPLKT